MKQEAKAADGALGWYGKIWSIKIQVKLSFILSNIY